MMLLVVMFLMLISLMLPLMLMSWLFSLLIIFPPFFSALPLSIFPFLSFFSLFQIFLTFFPPQAVSFCPFLIILSEIVDWSQCELLFAVYFLVAVCGISGRVKYLLILFFSTGGWCEGTCPSDVDSCSSFDSICSSAIILVKGPAGD